MLISELQKLSWYNFVTANDRLKVSVYRTIECIYINISRHQSRHLGYDDDILP